MRLSITPDLSTPRRLLILAIGVTVVVSAVLASIGRDITSSLGDTDDALRLVQVRELLAGRGWYDQLVTRFQPPAGLWMHWSRLLDGAIAGFESLLRLGLPAPTAEWATRFFWPLLLIFPCVACLLAVARSLGDRSAVLIAAILLVIVYQPYVQFRPGRIDHHNVQILLAMAALAAAVSARESLGSALTAGAASGLGLAIGLEALPFHALVGAGFAVALLLDRGQWRRSACYAAALTTTTWAAFLAQTPPARWGLSFCDALGINLVVAVSLAGLGLMAASLCARGRRVWPVVAILAATGGVSLGAFLSLDPACLAGPLGAVDPRVRPFWFDQVQELQTWPRHFVIDRGAAIYQLVTFAMALAALAYLAWSKRRTHLFEIGLVGANLLVAGAATYGALRMQDYLFWFSLPVIAAALSRVASRRLDDRLAPTVALAVLLTPAFVATSASAAADLADPPARTPPVAADACASIAALRPLDRFPPGLVLSDIDLGPHIIANTRHSAVVGPYHRMPQSILAAHEALYGPSASAEARVRSLGADYVAECPSSKAPLVRGSLRDQLKRRLIPAWLMPLSGDRDPVRLYRVRPLT